MELESKSGPLARPLYKNQMTKILAVAFKKNMILKEHKAAGMTKLFVMTGQIEYKSLQQTILLDANDDMDIPLEELHSVRALKDSLIILIIETL